MLGESYFPDRQMFSLQTVEESAIYIFSMLKWKQKVESDLTVVMVVVDIINVSRIPQIPYHRFRTIRYMNTTMCTQIILHL